MNRRIYLMTGMVVGVLVCFYACGALYQTHNIEFVSDGDTIAGVINIPTHAARKASMPLAIFVHGDGAMDADAAGFYKPIWKTMAKCGIASMSWSKKGIGSSQGNWLEQSMEDRARMVIAAIDQMKNQTQYSFSAIGLIGFSQAGWVLPKVSALSGYPDFMILVSGAINWKDQSQYLTRKRLELAGVKGAELDKQLQENEASFRFFEEHASYQQYVVHERNNCMGSVSDCDILDTMRYQFIKANIDADVTKDLEQVHCPVFGVFGEEDLNVNFQETYRVYKNAFSRFNKGNYKLKIYPEATHGLLKSKHFNVQKPGLGFMVKFELFGKQAFAPGVLDDICNFVIDSEQEAL